MPTNENLQAAFAGESQANRRYLAFSKQAELDGLPQVALLFRAAAEAETVHALAHLRVMGDVKTTADNLKAAVAGENYEFTKMYPAFVAEARQENNSGAIMSFSRAMDVEAIHEELYTHALSSVQGGKDLPKRRLFVCSVCGNTVYDDVPDRCPICSTPKERFNEVK